ncbi:MAG TPA: protein kinase [Candidatus Krumholzibacteria bacterium]|nr:protein kinase [Candidatus Krumholzibacteria bacterium]
MPEKSLGHYQILEKLGQGGMGEVWRAHDQNLDRDVALKLLPLDLANDPERIARFRREARVLASLNHPNIAHLHGFEEDKGQSFLVMELVEGEELAQLIERGPLPIPEAVTIGRQIAAALESAHRAGIVHRDLKPANVMLTAEGRVKILDFGLARAFSGDDESEGDIANSPTITAAMTQAGTILGTAAYMSPEQARGKKVDQRSDIWAFGVILHELLTGSRLFAADTVSDTVANVLKSQLDQSQLPANTPPALRRVLRRCLQRDPDRRWHAASDLRIELEECLDESASGEGETAQRASSPLWRRTLPWVAAAVISLLAVFGPWRTNRSPADSQILQLSVPLPYGMTLDGGPEQMYMAISRDGETVAYVGREEEATKLYLRRLNETEARGISDTDGANNPFFSPDGDWLGFFSNGYLRKVSTRGGGPVDLCPVQVNRGGTWLPDDTIVFSPGFATPLVKIGAAGGTPEPLTKIDTAINERTHRWPARLGDDWIMFTVGDMNSPGDYEDAHIDAISMKSGKRITLIEHASMARFLPPHTLLYARGGVLQQVRVTMNPPHVSGNAVPVLEGVAGERSSGSVHFDVADDGTLAYVRGGSGLDPTQIIWTDRNQNIHPLDLPPNVYGNPRFSPDGKSLLVRVGIGSGMGDVWLFDFERETLRRMTFENRIGGATWLPDGSGIVYNATPDSNQLTLQPLDSAKQTVIYHTSAPLSPSGVTPDGKQVLFSRFGAANSDVEIIPIQENAKPRALVSAASTQWAGVISPNGHWVAYCSDESGHNEVYVQAMQATGKWQVSNNGGTYPLWSPDGKELYYVSHSFLMSVPVQSDATHFSLGAPDILLNMENTPKLIASREYDINPDGSAFVYTSAPLANADRRQLSIILNWSPKKALVAN